MATSRRAVLAGMIGAGVVPGWLGRSLAAPTRSAIVLGARVDPEGAPVAAGFDLEGRMHFQVPLPGRGHSFAVHPYSGQGVAFARRPGRFARVFSLVTGNIVADFDAGAERHFYGHGIHSRDGELLYAPENDYEGGRGVIGIYDARDRYRRLGEIPSHGIGPHDLRLLRDGTTLVIANGGILTHPDLPRVKLNVATMRPSLAYIDRRSGRLVERVELDPVYARLSIRHLDVRADDTVAFAMQYEGPNSDLVPLVGLRRPGAAPVLFAPERAELRRMKNYCGAVAFDRGGRFILASHPRGNLMTCWDAETGALRRALDVADGCGVAAGAQPGRFVVSGGGDGAEICDAATGTKRRLPSPAGRLVNWDNHLVVGWIG